MKGRTHPHLRTVCAALALAALLPLASWTTSAQTRPATAPTATDMVVRVLLEEADGSTAPAAGAVVWVTSSDAVATDRTPTVVDWPGRGELPVVIPKGTRLRFRLEGGLAHNLFSSDRRQPFDVDLTTTRATADLRTERPGAFAIYCNDHAAERVDIVVTDGPHRTTDGDGRTVLPALARDADDIEVWHPRAGPAAAWSSLSAELVARLPARRRAQHRNKHGEPYPPPPGSLEVRVERLDKGKARPASGAVIWLESSPAPYHPGRRPGAPSMPEIGARKKRFTPRVVSVPVGSIVDFPNHDRIFHNVFSLSSAKPFDLGLYRNGKSKSVTFDTPGIVQIFCNIHPKMAAYVIVVDGEIHAVTGDDGRVTLDGVKPGTWNLRVWDERGGEHAEPVAVVASATAEVAVRLDASSFRQTQHKNKHGEEYPDPDDEESRY